jgi:hypothetical protein
MREHTTHNLAERLNLRRTGRLASLALAVLAVLFLAWLIFFYRRRGDGSNGVAYTLTKSVVSSGSSGLAGGVIPGGHHHNLTLRAHGGNYTLGGGFWSGAGSIYHIYLPLVMRN